MGAGTAGIARNRPGGGPEAPTSGEEDDAHEVPHRRPGGRVSDRHLNLLGWVLFVISAIAFVIASIGSFWAMVGSVFFLVACLVFLIPFFR